MNGTIFEERERERERERAGSPGVIHVAVRALIGVLALLIACSLDVTTAYAQATAVCNNMPTSSQWIKCTENAASANDIYIDTSNLTISTTGLNDAGIQATHGGTGKIDIKSMSDTITTTGTSLAYGIWAYHNGTTGDVTVRVTSPTIQAGVGGIVAESTSSGKLDVDFTGGSITTTGDSADGIVLWHAYEGAGKAAPTTLDVDGNAMITTSGSFSDGVSIFRRSDGRNELNLRDVTIGTMGAQAYGVFARQDFNFDRDIIGNVEVNLLGDVSITTKGDEAHGISAEHEGLNTDVESHIIVTARGTNSITTTGASAYGIQGVRRGSGSVGGYGKIRIDARDVHITTRGSSSTPVLADHHGVGDIEIDVRNATLRTEATGMSAGGPGILGFHRLFGSRESDVNIYAEGGSITTKGLLAHGIAARHSDSTHTNGGDITIRTRDHDIVTESTDLDTTYQDTFSTGVYALHQNPGNIDIDLQSGSIETRGVNSYGVYGNLEEEQNGGAITIATRGGHSITTTGTNGHGIVAYNYGTLPTSTTSINVGGNITTTGAGAQGVRVGTLTSGAPDRVAAIGADGYRQQTVTVNGAVTSAAEGVYLAGGGRVVIGSRGSINSASGIAILAIGDTPVDGGDPIKPKLRVDLNLGGRLVAQALGDNWIINDGGETTIAVNRVTLHDGATGNTGRTAPNGAWNVRMREEGVTVTDRTDPDPMNWMVSEPAVDVITDRDFSAGDFNETARPRPPTPPPPPMPQTVMVDEPVFGAVDEVAGVYLPAGGRVLIGPAGTVGGESGIAILAGGDAPMLHVDLRLNGRRVMEVIGDDWIINDGGETTIVVNDVTLHDGPTGVVADAVAPNGAWNVRMKAEGVTVDRTDPDNWVITEPAAGVVADRDFSTDDFIETSTQPEPTKPPLFTEEYAPRAALYELLPDFLLRLTGPGPNRRCLSAPDSSIWTRVAGGQGAYESDRSTTGATYDLERFEAEGGLSASLGKRAKGWVSVRHVTGSAGVASPTGGGAIDVRGLGSSVGGSWQGANDVYAVGCFSYLAYDVDFASKQQGVLKAGVDGHSYTLDLEAGRRFAMGEQWHLTPRVWVVGSRVSVDDFTDAVDSRVSLSGADRILGGLGVLAETVRPWGDDGEFALRGSVDYERMFRGATTTTQVSGEQLSAVATDNSLLVGLNGVYRQGRFSIGAEVAARQELGSTDSEYTSFLNLGMRF